MIEIFKEFTFDAAHQLAVNVPQGHPYGRLHGHSFSVCVYLRGTPDPKTGWLMDFSDLEKAIAGVRDRLDHNYLNEIEGLQVPTLENISRWIWEQLKPKVPFMHRVTVQRATLGEGCTYSA